MLKIAHSSLVRVSSDSASHVLLENELDARCASIREALAKSGYPHLRCLGCSKQGDKICLSGAVPNYHQKQYALHIIQTLAPLTEIEDCLEVIPFKN